MANSENLNQFGIYPASFKEIMLGLAKFKDIDEAYIFGSRAKGNYHKGSDIDIAIKGASLAVEQILNLSAYLNERSPTPYFFDIVWYNEKLSQDLKDHIDRVGILFYRKTVDNPNWALTKA